LGVREETRSVSERPHRDRYFVNAPVDFALIGGASLLLYFLCLYDKSFASSARLATLSLALVWVCNYPHFASTNYRLYRTRSNVRQYPMTATLVPALLVTVVVACFASPHAVAPLFVKLYLIWSPYHFSAQTLGITLIYARRSGFEIRPWERKAIAGFIFLTFAQASAYAELSGVKPQPFYAVSYPVLGLHEWLPHLLRDAMWACLIVFGAMMLWRALHARQIIPWIVLLPAAAQAVWFVPRGSLYLVSFAFMVPFFHSLQYLLIAWSVQMKESQDESGARPSWRFVGLESLRWVAICGIGGVILFWALPHIGGHFGEPLGFSIAVIFAAVQVHHFFVDGVIWKLKNPRVQSPTMTTLRQLTGSAAGRPRQASPRGGELSPVPVPVR
jgi:hypothetical protein